MSSHLLFSLLWVLFLLFTSLAPSLHSYLSLLCLTPDTWLPLKTLLKAPLLHQDHIILGYCSQTITTPKHGYVCVFVCVWYIHILFSVSPNAIQALRQEEYRFCAHLCLAMLLYIKNCINMCWMNEWMNDLWEKPYRIMLQDRKILHRGGNNERSWPWPNQRGRGQEWPEEGDILPVTLISIMSAW